MNENSSGALTALTNLINTCYINSIIQILRHTESLNYVLDNKYKNLKNNTNTLELFEWKQLKDLMWSKKCLVSPNRFNAIIKKSTKMNNFTDNHDQQDVSEYLIKILETFHLCIERQVNINISGEIKTPTDFIVNNCYKEYKKLYSNKYSEIIDLFYGMQVTAISHLNNKKILSTSIEPFSLINLVILEKAKTSLYDCLDEYCKNEILDGENQWVNDKDNSKHSVNIKTLFFQLPEILIFTFKKFSDKKQNITFPISNLDMSKYMITKTSTIHYQLYAICNHYGSSNGGHYYSYIFYNNKWFCFNDTEVKPISINNLITPCAYCLFYKKKH